MENEPRTEAGAGELDAWDAENARLWKFLRYGGMALIWPLGLFAFLNRDGPPPQGPGALIVLVVVLGAVLAYTVVSLTWIIRLHRRRWRMRQSRGTRVSPTARGREG